MSNPQDNPLTPPGFKDLGLRADHPVEQLQLARAIQSERDFNSARWDTLKQMIADRDQAISVLNDTVNKVPTEVQQAVVSLQALMTERFSSIELQFKERDTRQVRESTDNKVAVDAAFAAQKESALAQDTSNAKAISKSEAATTEAISKLGELQSTTTQALSDKVDDLKDRITSLESEKMGVTSQRTERREASNLTAVWSSVGVALVIGLALVVITLIIHSGGG